MNLQFKNFKRHSTISHLVTTRNGGSSIENFESLNLSYKVGDDAEHVDLNRKIVSKMLNIDHRHLHFPDQCHTSTVKILYGNGSSDLSETDALITSEKGIGIGVLAADCVPVLFFDPKKKIVAAAHAGWRGTVKRIVSEVIKKMDIDFGSRPEDIIAGIGPGISQKHYEVDESVIVEVEKAINQPERFYKPSKRNNRYLLNLQDLNLQMLIDCGLYLENIEVLRTCTFENSDLFFSARRDGFNTGRFGAVIALR